MDTIELFNDATNGGTLRTVQHHGITAREVRDRYYPSAHLTPNPDHGMRSLRPGQSYRDTWLLTDSSGGHWRAVTLIEIP